MKKAKILTTNYEDPTIVKQYGVYPLIHQVIGKPKFMQFIGDVVNKNILDFGCGNGHITFELDKQGARCIGVDPSNLFIAEAKKRYPSLDFQTIERSNLDGFKSKYFDKIILCLILPSINSKQEFKALFKESSRVLKVNGELILSTLHPAMVRNMKDGIRRVRIPSNMNYFSTGARFQNDVMLPDKTWMTFNTCQWTLEDISNELIANNFTIAEIKEPTISKNKYSGLLKDILRTPYYIFIKAKKLDSKKIANPSLDKA